MRSVAVLASIAGVLSIGACSSSEKKMGLLEAGPPADFGASAIEAGAAANASAREAREAREAHAIDAGPMRECRVMASESGPGPEANPSGWLDVVDKGNFTVRTMETGRELRFEGPGRVRACGGDVALIALGSAVGLPSTGETPGVEQWVATACGVARWASGVHRFVGGRDACRLQTSMGTVHLWLAGDVVADEVLDGGAPDGSTPAVSSGDAGAGDRWGTIDTRRTYRLHGRAALDTPIAVKAALDACDRTADIVQSLAARMSSPEAGANANLGTLASESVVARGVARSACAVAAVRIQLGGSKPADLAWLEASSARFRASR